MTHLRKLNTPYPHPHDYGNRLAYRTPEDLA
jgi:hypothetical protein